MGSHDIMIAQISLIAAVLLSFQAAKNRFLPFLEQQAEIIPTLINHQEHPSHVKDCLLDTTQIQKENVRSTTDAPMEMLYQVLPDSVLLELCIISSTSPVIGGSMLTAAQSPTSGV